MRVRGPAGRCCCDDRPPTLPIPAIEYGWWNITDTASVVQQWRDVDNGNISYGALVESGFSVPVPAPQYAFSGFFTFEVSIGQGTLIQAASVDMGTPLFGPFLNEPQESYNAGNPNLSPTVLPQSNVYAACQAYCENVDDVQPLPVSFLSGAMNNLPRTVGATDYPLEWWRGQGALGLVYSLNSGDSFQTLDITAPLQEAVNRPGWISQLVRIFLDWDSVRGPHVPIGIDGEFCGAWATPRWTGNTRPRLTLVTG